jgi:hypothetical protein
MCLKTVKTSAGVMSFFSAETSCCQPSQHSHYLKILVALFPRTVQFQTIATDGWLHISASTVRGEVFNGVLDDGIIFSRWGHFTNKLCLGNIPYGSKSRFGITISQGLDKFWIRLVDFEFSTGKTNTFEDFLDLVKEA